MPAARTGRTAFVAAAAAVLAAGCGGGAGRPQTHAVEIRNFVYVPASVAAAPGDTVVFTNRDAVPHTATAADGSWDSGEIAAGASWRLVVPAAGGGYACTYHPTMKGAVEVE